MQSKTVYLFTLTFAAYMLTAQSAWAQSAECASDEDCEQGMSCVQEANQKTCQFRECDSDEDCDSEMLVCATSMSTAHCDTSCLPYEDDPTCAARTAEIVCEAIEVSHCSPKYLYPCASDDDCGEGFQCVAEENCSAAGFNPEIDDTEHPRNTCAVTGEKYCELIETSCDDDDSNCPEGWSCGLGPMAASSANFSSDGDSSSESTANLQCLPPYWGEVSSAALEADIAQENTNTSGYSDPSASETPSDPSASETERVSDNDDSCGGCQMDSGSSAKATTLYVLLVGLGLALVRRRR